MKSPTILPQLIETQELSPDTLGNIPYGSVTNELQLRVFPYDVTLRNVTFRRILQQQACSSKSVAKMSHFLAGGRNFFENGETSRKPLINKRISIRNGCLMVDLLQMSDRGSVTSKNKEKNHEHCKEFRHQQRTEKVL
jgi:hypothetical protein